MTAPAAVNSPPVTPEPVLAPPVVPAWASAAIDPAKLATISAEMPATCAAMVAMVAVTAAAIMA